MQFLIEQLDPSAGELVHTAVVTGRSGVLEAARGVTESERDLKAALDAIADRPEGELVGAFGVFRFAPAG